MTFRVRSMLLANRVVGIVLPTWATDTLDIVVPILAHTRSTLLKVRQMNKARLLTARGVRGVVCNILC